MAMLPVPDTVISPVASFPKGSFLENLAVRSDGSILVTSLLHKQLWLVPNTPPGSVVDPILVHTFGHPVTGIVEIEPDMFIVCLTEGYTTHESHLARFSLADWTPGEPLSLELIATFDDQVRALNGCCLLGSRTILIADSFGPGRIWRVDLDDDAHKATARTWLVHDTMAEDPDGQVAPPQQPGINGVQFSPETGFVYYTSTAQKVFMRVPVDPDTLDPAGNPEFVAAIDNADDFCLAAGAGFAYVTRHRANSLDRVPLTPGHGSEVRHVAGDPYDELLTGPSSAAWGRCPGERGRVMYVTTDGGTTAPPDGTVRRANVLRVELQLSTE